MKKKQTRLNEVFGINEAEAGTHMFWVTDENNEYANWLVVARNEADAIDKALKSIKDPQNKIGDVSEDTLSVFRFDDVEYVGAEGSGWLGFTGTRFKNAHHKLVKKGDHNRGEQKDEV